MRTGSHAVATMVTTALTLAGSFVGAVAPAHADHVVLGSLRQPTLFPVNPPVDIREQTYHLGTDSATLSEPRSIAVYRPSTQDWLLREASGTATTVHFGAAGDQPVPADYLDLGQPQIAVFRPSTREWIIRTPFGSTITRQFGGPGDVPVPGDYLGAGHSQIAIYRPSTRYWFIREDDGSTAATEFGGPNDRPVPGDYLGLGSMQIAVFRPETGQWFVHTRDGGTLPIQWGAPGDLPVAADYAGDGHAQIAVFRPSTREWIIRGGDGTPQTVAFGGPDDQPVPGDYFGLGHTQVAVYRPESSEWFVRTDEGETVATQFGEPGDVALPAGFSPSFGTWQGRYSGIRTPLTAVIREPEQWAELWNSAGATAVPPPPVPEVDFRRQMIVAVFQGERPSGGYAIGIDDVRYAEDAIWVDVLQQEPAADVLTAQVITAPFSMVAIRQSALPVRFVGVETLQLEEKKSLAVAKF